MIHDLDLVLARSSRRRSGRWRRSGVSVFGGHEDVANARIEFEDGCVANLTASRVSFQAVRKMRLWGAEGYASLDFAAKAGDARSAPRTASAAASSTWTGST